MKTCKFFFIDTIKYSGFSISIDDAEMWTEQTTKLNNKNTNIKSQSINKKKETNKF